MLWTRKLWAFVVATASLFALDVTPGVAQYTYTPIEHRLLVGEPFDVLTANYVARGLVPQFQFKYNPTNGAMPPGLNWAAESGSIGESPFITGYSGFRISGTPTTPGFYAYVLDWYYTGTTTFTNSSPFYLIVFASDEYRDVVEYYTNLMQSTSGPDHFYWSALRGYYIGLGVEDEGLAYYSYYSSLGSYYYTALSGSAPNVATYYYWYYTGIGYYYLYSLNGDSAMANAVFGYYATLANSSL